MIKTVKVVIEKEFTIGIPDNLLTPEHIVAFNSFIGLDAHVDDIEECQEELFGYVACMAARGYSDAEGMGDIGSEYMKQYAKDKNYYIVADEIYDEIETRNSMIGSAHDNAPYVC